MKDWFILGCIGFIAVLAFRERGHWTSQPAPSPAASVSVESPAAAQETHSVPPPPPAAAVQLAPDDSAKAELANLVAQSQRLALAKYPALGTVNSEINIRFNFRYKRMLADYSPRLQDPNWPLQLADECAQAANVHPVAAAHPATTPPPSVAASRPASMPPGVVTPAVASAPSLRLPHPAPAAAQTLVFHPATGSASQPTAAVNRAPVSAPKPSNDLPFVTMDAVNQSSGNSYTYNWGSYYGWYDISFRQSVGISIDLKNMSRTPAALNLRWIFFARNTGNNARFVFAASGKELDLTPGQSTAVAADSPMIHSREVNYGWIGDRYLTGSKYEGWLVQLLERGSNRLIRQTGSTSYLEDLAKRSDFSSLIDDYRTKMHGQAGAGL